jgi:lipopolysaccharide transport system ATP-binding protein
MAGVPKVVVEKYIHFSYQKTYENDASLEKVNLEIVNDNAENRVPEFSIGYESTFSFNENLGGAQGWKTGAGKIVSIQLNNLSSKNENSLFVGGELVELAIKANLLQDFDRPIIGFLLKDRLGQILFGENTLPYTDLTPFHGSAGEEIIAKFKFRLPMLPNGQYVMHASLANGSLYSHIQHHWLHDAMILTVASNKIRWGLVGLNFEEISLCK